jgi:acyl dehydratase
VTVNSDQIGKQHPPRTYQVGREKVREYAWAVGETNPLYLEVEAARAAGYSDVVAPPMFCVVYSAPAMAPAVLDPALGINIALMVHGSQQFEWEEPVLAGDEITTTVSVKDVYAKNELGFYVWESVSRNQDGATTVTGTWTNIVRAG